MFIGGLDAGGSVGGDRVGGVAMLVFGRFVELPILVVLPCSDVFIKADDKSQRMPIVVARTIEKK